MYLHKDPTLAEVVPSFTRQQLGALAHKVEQLEHDIEDYIKNKQEELRQYEQELLAHHRSMDHKEDGGSADREPSGHADGVASAAAASNLPSSSSSSSSATVTESQPTQPPPSARKHEPEEKAKRTKHTRVLQKREKELYGLVTPVFLPLLDARDASPRHDKTPPKPQQQRSEAAPAAAQPAHATPARDAERDSQDRTPSRDDTDMEGGAAGAHGKEPAHVLSPKKTKRSTAKKSALRQNNNNTSRARRKRVSLVIDGHTVLPADTVTEPALTSPSSEATSASNSTASLDDMIDPRLTAADPHIHTEHYDAVHHSLPLPMSNMMHSPTKPLVETPNSFHAETPTWRTPIAQTQAPAQPPAYNPPSVAHRSFLDPSPTHPASLPAAAGPDPIFADDPILDEETSAEASFNTYVGGLHGSGTDDVDQAGSYGYPSSLGASYLESYMQSRPLRVRMEAADRAGLDEREKKVMMSGTREEQKTDGDEDMALDLDIDGGEKEHGKKGDANVDEDMDIMGDMEGF